MHEFQRLCVVLKALADRRLVGACLAAALATAPGCSHCGLGLHDRRMFSGGATPGGSFFQDFELRPQTGDMEIDLASAASPSTPGSDDAYLTDTSCAKLFDGPYPGSPALCKVLVGPAANGKVSPRAQLDPGTYRLWIQGYSSNTDTVKVFIDIDIWDSSCRPPLQ